MESDIEKFSDVRNFLIAGAKVVLVRNQNQFVKKDHYVDLVAGKGFNPIYIMFENSVYFTNYDSEVFKFNIDSLVTDKIEGVHFDLITNADNLVVVVVKDVHGRIKSSVYDLVSLSEIHAISSLLRNVLITNGYLAGSIQDEKEIWCINFLNGDIWKKNIKDFSWITKDGEIADSKVCQIIGVYNKQLLIHLAKFLLISIDVESGEEIWRIENFYDQINHEQYINFDLNTQTPMTWHLDHKRRQLYLLARYYLIRVDLEQRKQFVELSFENNPSEERWNFTRTSMENDKIFFAGSKGRDFSANRIGILDLFNYKIVWDYHSKDGSYYMQAPRQFKNHLLVMNNLKMLCVFKEINFIHGKEN